MTFRISSPVLLPFGKDISVLEDVIDKKIYIAPMYKFWAKNLEIQINNTPTKFTMDYIRNKINDDYSGIITTSDYYGFFRHAFSYETANFLDKLYQIELDQNHRDILVLFLTTEIEKFMDDENKCKKIYLGLDLLNYMLEYPEKYIKIPRFRQMEIYIVKHEVCLNKFGTVYDSIPRVSRMYDPYYLGFVSLFSGIREKRIEWFDVFNRTIKDNLIHGGYLYLKSYPREYEDKIVKFLSKQKFKKFYSKNIWRKPDIKVKKISKGINRYF